MATQARKGCGTCRERKIMCDRTEPSCLQCNRSMRKCKGYGLRLSWPRPGDNKRSVVLKHAKLNVRRVDLSAANTINFTHWDLQMYHYLRSSSRNAPSARVLPNLEINIPFDPFTPTAEVQELVQYFQQEAYRSLTVFGEFDQVQLRDLILRAAFPTDTPLAQAVLQSLLALTLLQRDRLGPQAFNLKTESIGLLAKASTDNMSTKEAIQHICASMLICSFEVHQSSCTSNQWTWYIVGIQRGLLGPTSNLWDHDDVKILSDWVLYHQKTALFTLRHWRTHGVAPPKKALCAPDVRPEVSLDLMADCKMVRPGHRADASPAVAILEVLVEICQAMPTKPPGKMSVRKLAAFTDWVGDIERRIHSIPLEGPSNSRPELSSFVHLFKLALLVYLYRTSEAFLDRQAELLSHVETAFALLSRVETCERQFPLLILACEARTDEQRKIVLDLIARTEKSASSRSFNQVSLLVRVSWAQDLLADTSLGYWDKMTAIISCCSLLPSLV